MREIEENKNKLENSMKDIELGYKSSIEQLNAKNLELQSEIETYKVNMDIETRKLAEELSKMKLENETSVNNLNSEFDQQKESFRNEIERLTSERDKYYNDTITFKTELDTFLVENQTVSIYYN